MASQGLKTSTAARRVLSASSVTGDSVRNQAGDDLGRIEEIMLDIESGNIAYAVLSFGGFLSLGDKLFAVPWSAFELNAENHEFILNVEKATLESAPGFDKDNWPDFADTNFSSTVHSHYGLDPYWDNTGRVRTVQAFAMGQSVMPQTIEDTVADDAASRERIQQPDLPEELRRRPIDVTDFPGSEKDADLRAADPSRTYGVTDSSRWTRGS
jgi:sporulation protein YlmC with PRC-barrel domain